MKLELRQEKEINGDVFITVYKDDMFIKSFYIADEKGISQKVTEAAYQFYNNLKSGMQKEIIILETFNTEENG